MCPRASSPTIPAWPSAPTAGDSPFRPATRRSCGTPRPARSWAWTLPEGLQDTFAFRGPDQLLLLRRETRDVKSLPDSSTSPADHPRVIRLRNLLGDQPTEPIRVITDFNRHVHHTAATPMGSTSWSRESAAQGQDPHGQRLRCSDRGETLDLTIEQEARLWGMVRVRPIGQGSLPCGRCRAHAILLEMPSRALLRDFGDGWSLSGARGQALAICLSRHTPQIGTSFARCTSKVVNCPCFLDRHQIRYGFNRVSSSAQTAARLLGATQTAVSPSAI